MAAARRLAASGYVALALDPFAPYGSTPVCVGARTPWPGWPELNDRRQLSDLAMALAWLRDLPAVDADRVGRGGLFGRWALRHDADDRAAWPPGRGGLLFATLARGSDRRCGIGAGQPCREVHGTRLRGLRRRGRADPTGNGRRVQVVADADTRRRVTKLHIVPGRHFFANESRPAAMSPNRPNWRGPSCSSSWRPTWNIRGSSVQPDSAPVLPLSRQRVQPCQHVTRPAGTRPARSLPARSRPARSLGRR